VRQREAQRDPEFELAVGKWIEAAVGEPLADTSDLWVSLRSGVVLCQLVNRIVPNTVKKFAKTNLLPLVEMDNIQLYLKACWNLGIPSGDFFIVSDLYHKKSMNQVIQNIVSLSRVAPSLGYNGEPLAASNTGKDRVKNWEAVATGGPAKRIEDLEAGTPAERITQLSVQLGEAKHALDASKSDNFHLQATLKELRAQQAAERERWESERLTLENRLKKFAPIDDGGEGAPGSLAVKALELHYKTEMASAKAELEAERKRYAALEGRFEETKQKQSQTALELSRLKQDEKKKVGGVETKPVPEKPSWMSKVAAKKPSVRAPSVRMPTMTAEQLAGSAGAAGRARPESMALSDSEGSYRLSMMLQLKSGDGSADSHKTGFFFNAEDLGADGVEYLSEQLDTLFANQPIEADASTILNEMLLADAGRRTFTFALKEKLRSLNFQKVVLDAAPFLTLLSLVNSALTGMQLEKQIDYIAMTFLLGASRAVLTTGSKSQMEEYLADHLRDHSIWADVRFWEQHFWDVIGKAFKKKFARLSISKAQQSGWQEDQSKFLAQFIASFAHEMGRWSLPEAAMKEFFELVFERLVLPSKFQTATKAYYEKLVTRQAAKQLQDSSRMKHVSMVMTSSQAARLAGAGAPAAVASGGSDGKSEADANILQGWLKRKVHIMWITEWVSQSGTHLVFREFKSSTQKRIVVSLDKLSKVEVRTDTSLNSRCIFIEAGDMKVMVAPVRDTDEEVNYWSVGLKKMQLRFASGSLPKTPKLPPKSADLQQKQQVVAAGPAAAAPVTPAVPIVTVVDQQAPAEETTSSSPVKASRSPTFTRALPTANARASLFGVSPTTAASVAVPVPTAPLEGWMQLNVTKDVSKRYKALNKVMWTPLWFVQDGLKLVFYRSLQKDEELGVIDMNEVTQMETTTHEDVSGDVIRLLTKTIVLMLCPQNAEMFEYWQKGLALMRRRTLAKGSSANDLSMAAVQGAATSSPENFQIGRSRNKTQTLNTQSPVVSGISEVRSESGDVPHTSTRSPVNSMVLRVSGVPPEDATPSSMSPKLNRNDAEKLEGWVQFKGAAAAPKQGKGLFGTLKKMASSKWTPMWGVLSGSSVFLHQAPGDPACLGELELEHVTAVEELTDKEMVGSVLRLTMAAGEQNFLCPKEAEFAAWRDRIQRVHGQAGAKPASPGGANLGASSPSLGRSGLFGKMGRSSTASGKNLLQVTERAAPGPEESLSGWTHVEEGVKWTKQWLAQRGTILTLGSSPDDAQPRGHYDLLILSKVEGVTGPDAFGPAIMCWFGEFNTLLFAPERGHHNYWLTGLGVLLERYKPRALVAVAAAPKPIPSVFAVGAQVWAQFETDQLWYRARIDVARPGELYDVTFAEYGSKQQKCPQSRLRPLDDPAMLALLGTTLEQVTATASVDSMRPMSVQLPAKFAQQLKQAGTFLTIDPGAALREQAKESEEDSAATALQAESPRAEDTVEVLVPVTPGPETSAMSRKAVDSMFVGVLKDEDEDDDEDEINAEVEKRKQQEEEELKRVQAEERKEKLRLAKAARDSKAEEDRKAGENKARLEEEERQRQEERERAEEEEERKMAVEEGRRQKEAEEKERLKQEEEEHGRAEAARRAVEEAQLKRQQEEASRHAEEERKKEQKREEDEARAKQEEARRKQEERERVEAPRRAEEAKQKRLADEEEERKMLEAEQQAVREEEERQRREAEKQSLLKEFREADASKKEAMRREAAQRVTDRKEALERERKEAAEKGRLSPPPTLPTAARVSTSAVPSGTGSTSPRGVGVTRSSAGAAPGSTGSVSPRGGGSSSPRPSPTPNADVAATLEAARKKSEGLAAEEAAAAAGSPASTRSAAVQAALARAKARTAAIKTDSARTSGAEPPRKPLPDPFG
jgi:hypothetical protein